MGKVGKLICGLLGIILLLGGILWTGIAVSCFTGVEPENYFAMKVI